VLFASVRRWRTAPYDDPVATFRDVELRDGRTLAFDDSGAINPAAPHAFTIVWHGGSPQTGALLAPLREAAAARGIRIIAYARPSYGGSTTLAERDVASAAEDVEQLADALGLKRFAVLAHSGGGPHALACAALMPGRVSAAAIFAGIAPFPAGDRSGGREAQEAWFAGMAADGESLRAAAAGRPTRVLFETTAEFDPSSFNGRDYAILGGEWAAMGEDAGAASRAGSEGLVADDLAFVKPWGFEPGDITSPVLLVQGDDDRVIPASHARSLADSIPGAELWPRPLDGHISILEVVPLAMDWLREHS
jgi:pimeloyl-ACP methyl ester carboxylesterase